MFGRFARVMTIAAAGLAGSPALAQDAGPMPTPAFESWSPTWSSPEIEALAGHLTGSWITAEAVAEAGGDAGGAAKVVMNAHPVPVEGLPDALYVEQYRTDDPGQPYRQSFYQFYMRQGEPRVRTFEIKKPEESLGVFVGMGLVPEAFPEIAADDLIATLDLAINASSDGFRGRTPYPYPTAMGGAVEMTSAMSVQGDTMTAAATGFAADGSVLWGGDSGYAFNRSEPHIEVDRRDNGLIVMNFTVPEGEVVADGDTLHVDYAGWLANGFRFDTSRQEGRDVFRFSYPPRLIDGWNFGLDGVTEGTRRRLVVPSELGYKSRGQPSAKIPPDSTLYFEIEVRSVQKTEMAPEPEMPDGEG